MNEMRPARDASREQAQFLRVLSRDEAMAREAALAEVLQVLMAPFAIGFGAPALAREAIHSIIMALPIGATHELRIADCELRTAIADCGLRSRDWDGNRGGRVQSAHG